MSIIHQIVQHEMRTGNFRAMPAPHLPVKERLEGLSKVSNDFVGLADSVGITTTAHLHIKPDAVPVDVYMQRQTCARLIIAAVKLSARLGTSSFLEKDIQDALF